MVLVWHIWLSARYINTLRLVSASAIFFWPGTHCNTEINPTLKESRRRATVCMRCSPSLHALSQQWHEDQESRLYENSVAVHRRHEWLECLRPWGRLSPLKTRQLGFRLQWVRMKSLNAWNCANRWHGRLCLKESEWGRRIRSKFVHTTASLEMHLRMRGISQMLMTERHSIGASAWVSELRWKPRWQSSSPIPWGYR